MASACVNRPGSSPEPFIDLSPACPRISFSREEGPITSSDSDPKLPVDFEFRPDDPITMLPADELFAGGKLLPLLPAAEQPAAAGEICLEEKDEEEEEEPIRQSDLSAPSPRAPRCSSRWRELLGLKKQQHQQQLGQKQESKKSVAVAAAAAAASHSKNRSLKQFLHRSVRSSTDPTLSLPLLRDSESESVSRRSLSSSSSSSSGPDHEDLPRHSLDSDKPAPAPLPISLTRNPPASRARAASRPRSAAQRTSRSPVRRQADAAAPRCPSIDSPRMNASGRVVFERSSSSPGSFTGGPRVRQRGMERSYSAGIRVAPVLNVPVFGLGQLFKKDREGVAAVAGAAGSSAGIAGSSNRIKTERP